MASIEEKVEDYFKGLLRDRNIRFYGKTEAINESITKALENAKSKTGGNGANYPDIKLLLEDNNSNRIPVMIEAKGKKGKLEKLDKDGVPVSLEYYSSDIKNAEGSIIHKKGDAKYDVVRDYAVNGALHYGLAVLDEGTYNEVVIIGINGSELDNAGKVKNFEFKAYYVSEKNGRTPKCITMSIEDIDYFTPPLNTGRFIEEKLKKLALSAEELEQAKARQEAKLETNIQTIHQKIYDDNRITLETNEKLFLFCGLIMAGLKTEGVHPLEPSGLNSNDDKNNNDSTLILTHIRSFLQKKECPQDKLDLVVGSIKKVIENESLWKPVNGESIVKELFRSIKENVIPFLSSPLHLDFMGKIFNKISDWVHIENDAYNDVVLTPRHTTNLMARLARTDKDSCVWDWAMGTGGFLVSAMEIMLKDAEDKIADVEELERKKKNIKENQLLGIEVLDNVFLLAVLNMILMGDGSSNIFKGNSLKQGFGERFPATVFLLNPPYSKPGKGLVFVEKALSKMTQGYACVLIQENAGSGEGGGYSKKLLEKNTLVASIHMPDKLFIGKSSVQTAIYVFKVATPHHPDNLVKFIDFSDDGFTRSNRRKSNSSINLRDTGNAAERYDEVVDIVLGRMPKTEYYTKDNGLYIEDTVTLSGDDWTYKQHQVIDTTPTEEDFKKVVAEYLSWKVGAIMKGEINNA